VCSPVTWGTRRQTPAGTQCFACSPVPCATPRQTPGGTKTACGRACSPAACATRHKRPGRAKEASRACNPAKRRGSEDSTERSTGTAKRALTERSTGTATQRVAERPTASNPGRSARPAAEGCSTACTRRRRSPRKRGHPSASASGYTGMAARTAYPGCRAASRRIWTRESSLSVCRNREPERAWCGDQEVERC
jgi:hypothetical protein